MENARIHLRRKDCTPPMILSERRRPFYSTRRALSANCEDFGDELSGATENELLNVITAAMGRTAPGAFKVEREYADISERRHPLQPRVESDQAMAVADAFSIKRKIRWVVGS